jgi:hypothetical protein
MEMPMDDGLNALLEGAVPLRQNTQIERGKHARSELEGRDSRESPRWSQFWQSRQLPLPSASPGRSSSGEITGLR